MPDEPTPPNSTALNPTAMNRRTMTIAGLFGAIGLALVALLGPGLADENKSVSFDRPPDEPRLTFDPGAVVTVIGILFLAAAMATLFVRGGSVAKWLRLAATAAVIPLLLAVALALSESSSTNVVNLLNESLVLATPLVLGSMTGLWSERSGIINIGIEGMMLSAAGVGFTAYAVLGRGQGAGWLLLSILVAVLVGGLAALLLAVLSIRYSVNQIIAGVAINLFALGLTGFLRSQVIVPREVGIGTPTAEIGLPGLSSLPVVGEQLFRGKPIYFLTYLVVVVTWFVMYRTPWGLRVRSCGENPHAAETLGVNVIRIRYQSVVLGGFIAGLAGAWFSMEAQARFEDNMTNSAGFIALAALIFGKWTPFGAAAGAILFGFARALGSRLQILKVSIGDFEIPSEFFQSLPFIVTIVVVAGALGRAVPPAAEGEPFRSSQ